MPTHIRINVGKPSRARTAPHRDDELTAGWSAERKPKDEPYIANKNLRLGNWISRASQHSGPQYAPGTGKSSR